MTARKRKLRTIQLILLVISILMVYFTYYGSNSKKDKIIISQKEQKELEGKLANQKEKNDVFYNITYRGLDLSGNRYVLNAEEAINDENFAERIYLKRVEATFFMKDDNILKVFSDKAIYNNENLDMIFEENVKALYQNSELFAERAEFSNINGFLTISKKVRVIDERGILSADQLLLDVKKQNLEIVSFDKNKVNANIDLK